MHANYLDAIRKFEGFTAQAQWDYAQNTNGYGTRAQHAGEVIDKAEADRRFKAEIDGARAIVERHAPNVDEGTKAALTSLTFNAGDTWAKSGLGDAVRNGDLTSARALFLQYNKAGGEVLPGLVQRRIAEAAWIGGQTGSDATAAPGPLLAASWADRAATPPMVPVTAGNAAANADAPLLVQTSGERDAAKVAVDAALEAILGPGVSPAKGEGRLTQLLLAAKFLNAESARSKDGKKPDPLSLTL